MLNTQRRVALCSATLLFLASAGAASEQGLRFERLLGPGDRVPYGTVVSVAAADIDSEGDYAIVYTARVDPSDPDEPAARGLLNTAGWEIEPGENVETSIGPTYPASLNLLDLNDGSLAIAYAGWQVANPLNSISAILVDGEEVMRFDNAFSSWDYDPNLGRILFGARRKLTFLDDGRFMLVTWTSDLPDNPPGSGEANLVSRIQLTRQGWRDEVALGYLMPVTAPVLGEAFVAQFFGGLNALNTAPDGRLLSLANVVADWNTDGVIEETRLSLLIEDEVLLHHGMPVPGIDGAEYRFSSSTYALRMNASGSWVATALIRYPDGAEPRALFRDDGEIIARQGVKYDWAGGRSVSPVSNFQILDSGDILWRASVVGPDGTERPAVFFNRMLLFEEGVTMIDGTLVTTLSSVGVTRDGAWMMARFEFDENATSPGVYRARFNVDCPDFDSNGVVDIGDLNTVLRWYETEVSPGAAGDANGDGRVNASDLDAVLRYWNGGCA